MAKQEVLTAAEFQAQFGGKKKTNKFKNKVTVTGGIRFQSKHEAERWGTLNLLLKAGAITNLRRQVKYRLEKDGQLIANYIADFVYELDGKTIVEDAKGMRTKEYKLKAKLMMALRGITILET